MRVTGMMGRSTRGLTLLEVLVTAGIFSALVVMVLSTLSSTTGTVSIQSARVSTNRQGEEVLQKLRELMSESKSPWASSVRLNSNAAAPNRVFGTPTGWPTNQYADVIMFPRATNYNVLGGPFYIDPQFDQLWVVAPADGGELNVYRANGPTYTIDPAAHPFQIETVTAAQITLRSIVTGVRYTVDRGVPFIRLYRANRMSANRGPTFTATDEAGRYAALDPTVSPPATGIAFTLSLPQEVRDEAVAGDGAPV
ncbi:MAG: type II secretion system protein J, partial [Planctomycetota bacterium]